MALFLGRLRSAPFLFLLLIVLISFVITNGSRGLRDDAGSNTAKTSYPSSEKGSAAGASLSVAKPNASKPCLTCLNPSGQSHHSHYQRCPNRNKCGCSWQLTYSKLHSDIMKLPREQQRLVVFDAVESESSNRMLNAVTAFYFAMLTGRAFKIKWRGFYQLEQAMQPKNIDWVISDNHYSAIMQSEDIRWDMDFYHTKNKTEVNHIFARTNLRTVHPEKRVIRYTNNQGQLDLILSNPHHSRQIERWGMQAGTAVGCVYNFLFDPTAEVLGTVKSVYDYLLTSNGLAPALSMPQQSGSSYSHQLLSRGQHTREGVPETNAGRVVADSQGSKQQVTVIAIQVPPMGDYNNGDNGDSCFADDDWGGGVLYPFISCAEQLEQEIQGAGDAFVVRWYLVTDCHALRQAAATKYGDKVITNIEAKLDLSLDSRSQDMAGVYSAFGESWMLGLADYHIIPKASAFGRLGALRSMRQRNIFTVQPFKVRDCGLGDYDDLKSVFRDFIRV